MPVFCMCGAEKHICQICKADICGKDLPATWMELVAADEEHLSFVFIGERWATITTMVVKGFMILIPFYLIKPPKSAKRMPLIPTIKYVPTNNQ